MLEELLHRSRQGPKLLESGRRAELSVQDPPSVETKIIVDSAGTLAASAAISLRSAGSRKRCIRSSTGHLKISRQMPGMLSNTKPVRKFM